MSVKSTQNAGSHLKSDRNMRRTLRLSSSQSPSLTVSLFPNVYFPLFVVGTYLVSASRIALQRFGQPLIRRRWRCRLTNCQRRQRRRRRWRLRCFHSGWTAQRVGIHGCRFVAVSVSGAEGAVRVGGEVEDGDGDGGGGGGGSQSKCATSLMATCWSWACSDSRTVALLRVLAVSVYWSNCLSSWIRHLDVLFRSGLHYKSVSLNAESIWKMY